jgi:hypothetical protein
MKQRLLEIWTVAKQDRKKTATLGTLVLVALVMGIRALASGSAGPRQASAAGPAMKTTTAIAPIESLSVEDALALLRPQDRHGTGMPPDRDLFKSDWAVMGPPSGATGGKSEAQDADNPDAPLSAEGRREQIQHEASTLRLRSTMLGANPVAVIEKTGAGASAPRIARLGAEFEGFLVAVIEAHRVELEKEGVRIVLEQNK